MRAPAQREAVPPRVLVIAASLAGLRALEHAVGRSASVRGCLGARPSARALLTFDPTVIVLAHEPPALDAPEVLRGLRAHKRAPEVLLASSRGASTALETIAARHPDVRVVGVLDGELSRAVHEAHLRWEKRAENDPRTSGTRRRLP